MRFSKRCGWYMMGKLKDLQTDLNVDPVHPTSPQSNTPVDWETYNPEEDPDFEVIHPAPFLWEPEVEENTHRYPQAGPGPQTAANRIQLAARKYVLDDDDDQRITEWAPGTGRVIRTDTPPSFIPSSPQPSNNTMDDAMDIDDNENPQSPPSKYFPFSSELDWMIARWAIKDGPGHNAFDRLLEIPGVCLAIFWRTPFIHILCLGG